MCSVFCRVLAIVQCAVSSAQYVLQSSMQCAVCIEQCAFFCRVVSRVQFVIQGGGKCVGAI